ncbi:pyridoxal phosphate-dependent aminotransferase [Clostridium kluyveri]|uniref:pyridoxal phosphate-dependent aminotransferase n=1 Tax=Clostridium kluyveri TaxID=1534 RepID=UPI00224648E8|nr:pyridoxal phosphate-dependent aminotransferase [Clostridium kluyveri]UZQ50535.1 pyridoxal phosphate-dependent aminotransferase [Clostridium kluyveri]
MSTNKFPEMQISKKVEGIPEALSIYVNQLVYAEKRKGIDVTTLSLGEAFFDIPMFDFKELNFEKGYHYSESYGIPELREKIVKYYNSMYGANINGIDEVLISCGSKPIIYMVIQAILNEGDEVLIHEPSWLSYQEQIKLANGVPKFIPYDCTVKDFNHYYTNKTKILILNNPNNPAGWIYSKEELELLYGECRKKGIYILVDEAYSDFIDDGLFTSLAAVAPDLDGAVVVNSLSKNMGISGWRIGYVIAEKRLIHNILKLNQHLITCAPTILQMYLARYFDDIIKITLPQAKEVIKKRKRIKTYMDSIKLSYLPGDSTFYFFVSIDEFEDSVLDLSMYLLFRYGISTVPGDAYGKSTGKFIRIGIGVESEERLKNALDIIKAVIESKYVDQAFIDKKLKENGFQRFKRGELT